MVKIQDDENERKLIMINVDAKIMNIGGKLRKQEKDQQNKKSNRHREERLIYENLMKKVVQNQMITFLDL